MKQMGLKAPVDTIWLVKIYDVLMTALMSDKKHPYEPVAKQFIETAKPTKEKKFKSFSSVEEYEKARAKIINNER